MRAVQIVSTFPPYAGGTGAVADQIARHWPGLDTITPSAGDAPAMPRVLRMSPLFSVGNGSVLPGLVTALAGYDAVLLHYPFFGAVEPVLFQKLFRKKQKLIVYYHQDLVPPADAWRNIMFRLYRRWVLPMLIWAADTIAVSTMEYALAGDLAPYVRRYPEKFTEVPLGVDSETFRPLAAGDGACASIDRQLSSLAKPVFTFVGGLDRAHYFKGVEVLLDAVAELSRSRVAGSVVIAGAGELRSEYEARAERLGIRDRIVFAGAISRDELVCLLNRSYALVLPSVTRSEAFGLVLLEALSVGTPVITSDLPGVRTLSDQGRCGVTFATGDHAALAKALAELAAHPDRRLALSLQARPFARRYTWEQTAALLQRILTV